MCEMGELAAAAAPVLFITPMGMHYKIMIPV
jgi:hypothetical protein